MISRRRILSRSRDELLNQQTGYPDNYNPYEEEEDVWYSKDKLLKDHILEILNKWEQIDDEIWAKLIVMERNRRVAKAYARAPILTINGSEDGFDGYRIGLNGFDNPLRDPKTEVVKNHIGEGVKIRMDDDGNILIKRLAKSNVYVKGWYAGEQQNGSSGANGGGGGANALIDQSSSVSNEIIRNAGLLEPNKAVRLFDMKKFQANMSRELRRAYPDRRKLENQCICCIALVKDAADLLDLPVWVMVINIVAMDMLKSKMPPTISKRQSVPNLVNMFDRQKSSSNNMSDEDPYSLPGHNGSGGSGGGSSSGGSRSSGHYVSAGQLMITNGGKNGSSANGGDQKPPKLPPRDFERKQKQSKSSSNSSSAKKSSSSSKNTSNGTKESIAEAENIYGGIVRHPRHFDDPYYSGFSARVPNYAKRQSSLPMPNGGGSVVPTHHSHHHAQHGHYQQSQMPFKLTYNQQEFQARKVPSSGFLNSFLKTPNVIHSRTASYQSYYGSLGESDPYTASSESPGDESLGPYGDSTYGRIGMAPRFGEKHFGNGSSSNGGRQRQQTNGTGAAPATVPWIYRSANNDDYYGHWDD